MPKNPKLPKAPKPVKVSKVKIVKGYAKSNGQYVAPYIKGLFKI